MKIFMMSPSVVLTYNRQDAGSAGSSSGETRATSKLPLGRREGSRPTPQAA
jgi:hypothetical protein